MHCDAEELLAEAKCFACLSEKQMEMVALQLLCDITETGPTGLFLTQAANLSDVDDVAEARANLGLAFTPGSVVFADATGAPSEDNANLFWDNTLNTLKVGPRASYFHADAVLEKGFANYKAVSAANKLYSASYSEIVGSGTQSGNRSLFAVYNIARFEDPTGTITQIAGTSGLSIHSGGTVTTNYGGIYSPNQTGGTSTSLVGISAVAFLSGGITTNIYGGKLTTAFGGGTCTNEYGLRIDTGNATATVTNRYGIFVNLGHAAAIGHVIKLAGSASGDAFQVRNSADTVLTKIDSLGRVTVESNAFATAVITPGVAHVNAQRIITSAIAASEVSAAGAFQTVLRQSQAFITAGVSATYIQDNAASSTLIGCALSAYTSVSNGTNAASVQGIQGGCNVSGGTPANVFGLSFGVTLSGGSGITDISGISIVNTFSGGTATNSYSAKLVSGAGGTITNRFGIHLTCGHAGEIGHVIKLAATPTGDAFQILSSADAVLARITAAGQVRAGAGTDALPGISIEGDPNTGIYGIAGDVLGFTFGGNLRYRMESDSGRGFQLGSGMPLSWSNAANPGSSPNLLLYSGGSGILQQRNGTSSQVFQIFDTYTNGGVDYERLNLGWSASAAYVETSAGGTGVQRTLNLGGNIINLRTGLTNRWVISASGVLTSQGAGITIGGSAAINTVSKVLQGSAVIDPASVAAQTLAALGTITITGAVAGDTVFLGLPSTWANTNMVIKYSVTAADTVTIYGYNPNVATPIDLPSATIKAFVHQQ